MQTLAEWLRRKPKGKAARKRIPAMSERRANQMKAYRKLRREFLAKNPYCQIWMKMAGCRRKDIDEDGCVLDGGYVFVPRSKDIHHVRGRIGEMLNDTRHWLACSREMHEWVHSHPKEARRLGLLQ